MGRSISSPEVGGRPRVNFTLPRLRGPATSPSATAVPRRVSGGSRLRRAGGNCGGSLRRHAQVLCCIRIRALVEPALSVREKRFLTFLPTLGFARCGHGDPPRAPAQAAFGPTCTTPRACSPWRGGRARASAQRWAVCVRGHTRAVGQGYAGPDGRPPVPKLDALFCAVTSISARLTPALATHSAKDHRSRGRCSNQRDFYETAYANGHRPLLSGASPRATRARVQVRAFETECRTVGIFRTRPRHSTRSPTPLARPPRPGDIALFPAHPSNSSCRHAKRQARVRGRSGRRHVGSSSTR